MQNLETILWIVGGVAAILFLVATAMSYRTWRWHALTLIPLVLIAAGFFFGYAVTALKAQQQWREYHRALTAQLAKVELKNLALEAGLDKDGRVISDGLKQLRDREVELTLDRARMWPGCLPSAPDGTTGEVKVTVVEPLPHQIKKGMNLFVFDGRETAPGATYLGEYRVTAVVGGEMAPGEEAPADADAKKEGTPTAGKGASVVTLVPAWRILPWEQSRVVKAVKDSPGPWTLYEKMPPDSHRVFDEIVNDPVTGAPPTDKLTGRPLDRAAVDALRGEALRKVLPPSSLAEYAKDLQPAGPDDPLQRQAVKVEFLKTYVLPAPIGAAAAAVAAPPPLPSPAPHGPVAGAPPAAPQPAGDTSQRFQPGDVVWMLRHKVTTAQGGEWPGADDLVKDGIVKVVPGEAPRFKRELRDYAYLFRSLYLARQRIADEAEKIKRQTADQEAVFTQNSTLVKDSEEEQAKLVFDNEHYQFELAAVTAHHKALKEQSDAIWTRLRTLFLANQQLAAKLEEYERRAAAAIERRAPSPPQANLGPTADAAAAGL